VKTVAMTRARAAATHRARRFGASLERAVDPIRDLFDPDRSRYRPAETDDVVDYRSWFVASARVFDVFLRRARDLRSGNEGPHVAVVVTPWFGTPAPWFAIALGLALARRGSLGDLRMA